MSSSTVLPPEILDLIVDHLHTEPTTLKACSLVSKSWIPRTRRHLFDRVEFDSEHGPSLESWMKPFPDPSTSPAHHTRVLIFRGFPVITADATAILAHIRSFCRIAELEVATTWGNANQLSLVPLHGLSPTLKSLSLHYELPSLSEVLNLICSFPNLEDLALNHNIPGKMDWLDTPSTSPKLTGTLMLKGEHLSITRGLLSLPNGLHFSKITLSQSVRNAGLTMEVVSKCSDTLESLNLRYIYWDKTSIPPPFDLSKYPKLKDVEFNAAYAGWIVATLQSAKPKSLQRIVVHAHVTPSDEVGERGREWRDLDRLLSRLWTSHSVLLKVTCRPRSEGGVAQHLFPELADRGAVYNR